MIRFYIPLLLLILNTAIVSSQTVTNGSFISLDAALQSITVENAKKYIGTLANDSLKGQNTNTIYARKAANYISAQLKRIGIKTYRGKSYSHCFNQKNKIVVENSSGLRTVKDTVIKVCNVIGMIEGEIPDEYVIIGAHYDHLGYRRNIKPDSIYNGADDNASGVAGVLQVAQACLKTNKKPLRTIVFAFWDAEEIGLVGSEYFVENNDSIQQVKAYVNLDMIGRDDPELGDNAVRFSYLPKHYNEIGKLKSAIAGFNLNLTIRYTRSQSVGYSDYFPFIGKGIPAIWVSTGRHNDYHKVSDEYDKINWEKTTEISKAAFLTVWQLANNYYF